MMKYSSSTILVLSLILLGSCKKANTENPSVQLGLKVPVDSTITYKTTLKGDWELREIFGGLRAPNLSPYFAPGNGFIWKFTDSAYQLYSNEHLVSKGNYILTKDTSIATGRLMSALILPQNFNDKIYFEFNRDTLVFYRGVIAADGTIEKYVRLQNYR